MACAVQPVLDTLLINNEALGVLIELLNRPPSAKVCPGQGFAPTAAKAKEEKDQQDGDAQAKKGETASPRSKDEASAGTRAQEPAGTVVAP